MLQGLLQMSSPGYSSRPAHESIKKAVPFGCMVRGLITGGYFALDLQSRFQTFSLAPFVIGEQITEPIRKFKEVVETVLETACGLIW